MDSTLDEAAFPSQEIEEKVSKILEESRKTKKDVTSILERNEDIISNTKESLLENKGIFKS
jgi:uncharacterized membrane protein YgaE (UPF0421/DUF939 family)